MSAKFGHRQEKTLDNCYLCGRPLSCPTSKDHCPPRALFPPEIRRQHNLNRLITFRVHRDCNTSYSADEEYFIAAIVPFAPSSVAGDSIFRKFIADAHGNEPKHRLAEKILREFEKRPSGLYLPSGLVVKRQEGVRIKRIAWKIVRGLYYYHHGKSLLPEDIPVLCEITPPGQPPSEVLQYMRGLADDETHGIYGGVFDYRFRVFDTDLGKLNCWAFLIWDRIIMMLYFHDPWSCQCEKCVAAVFEMKTRGQGAGNGA